MRFKTTYRYRNVQYGIYLFSKETKSSKIIIENHQKNHQKLFVKSFTIKILIKINFDIGLDLLYTCCTRSSKISWSWKIGVKKSKIFGVKKSKNSGVKQANNFGVKQAIILV